MAYVCAEFQKFLVNYQDQPVAVEFECGGCCKKAVGILSCIAPGFIRLVSNYCHPFVKITIFCGNNPPEEECAKEIIIKKHSIIAVERLPFFDECPDDCNDKKHGDKKDDKDKKKDKDKKDDRDKKDKYDDKGKKAKYEEDDDEESDSDEDNDSDDDIDSDDD